MKTLRKNTTAKTIIETILTLSLTALFVWWGLHFPGPSRARADDAMPTPTPNCSPSVTPTAAPAVSPPSTPCPDPSLTPYPPPTSAIPSPFQPPDHAQLSWIVFPVATGISTPTPTPTATPTPTPMPGVILIHGGSWYAGDAFELISEGNQISAAGYFTVSVNYELAANGLIPGQPCHEDDPLWPSMITRQTDDIEAFVNAMRADPRCNGKIGLVGGSAGATDALYVAFDIHEDSPTTWPYWNGAARPDCVAVLSAPTNFGDLTPPNHQTAADPDFIIGTQNFTQGVTDLDTLKSLSPVSKVNDPAVVPFVPLFMVNSWGDHPPPYQQMVDMICAFQTAGVPASDYQTLTIPGTAHSFHYWGSWDHVSPHDKMQTVGEDVITFLNAHLK